MNLRSKLHDLKWSVTNFIRCEMEYQKELKAMSPKRREQRLRENYECLKEREKEFDEQRKIQRAEKAKKFKTSVTTAIQRFKAR